MTPYHALYLVGVLASGCVLVQPGDESCDLGAEPDARGLVTVCQPEEERPESLAIGCLGPEGAGTWVSVLPQQLQDGASGRGTAPVATGTLTLRWEEDCETLTLRVQSTTPDAPGAGPSSAIPWVVAADTYALVPPGATIGISVNASEWAGPRGVLVTAGRGAAEPQARWLALPRSERCGVGPGFQLRVTGEVNVGGGVAWGLLLFSYYTGLALGAWNKPSRPLHGTVALAALLAASFPLLLYVNYTTVVLASGAAAAMATAAAVTVAVGRCQARKPLPRQRDLVGMAVAIVFQQLGVYAVYYT